MPKSFPCTIQNIAPRQTVLKTARSAFFAAWMVGIVAFISYLMSLHAVPLPAATNLPFQDDKSSTIAWSWQATHVLAADCPCSKAIADHLLHRGPATDWDETIYVASVDQTSDPAVQDLSAQLTARGFRVTRIASTALQSELGVRGAPWLLFRDPQGHTLYSGGYAALRPSAGLKIDDMAILHRIQSGLPVSPNPAFGCAIDPALQKQMDPLALKYAPEP